VLYDLELNMVAQSLRKVSEKVEVPAFPLRLRSERIELHS
jgi:hypothetical protein